ncbi:MAG TPA: exodeoxyribonuclease III, partial [Saccharospirillum sp.]|nr:exodeoxyribonuclease III [Saccharospirillum sp.]
NDRFSWFDYRSRGFEDDPKRGLRIDHIMVSQPLVPLIKGAGIDYETRSLEKPSDHAPVWLDLDLKLGHLAL